MYTNLMIGLNICHVTLKKGMRSCNTVNTPVRITQNTNDKAETSAHIEICLH